MDRLNQLRGDAGASRDSTLDTSSLLGEGYVTANDSSKYFSLSEVDSSTNISPSKEAANDVTADSSILNADRIISDLSPIPKKSELDGFKIGEQIEAANILSGGVNIFDDNENSYDGDELVIDDAVVEGDDKPVELKITENSEVTFEKTDRLADTCMEDAEVANPSKDTEVVLQIDGKNVDAIDIGNGLYLYRKDGEEELAAVQILDNNQQQPDIKFLKVRENAEGNLEVYEEIEIEVPKEMPIKEGKAVKDTSRIPVKDVNKISEPILNKVAEHKSQAIPKGTVTCEVESDINKDNARIDSRTEVNLNGKMMKFSESRKSPLIGTFTPMTYHSTPNKEGIPLTKTMVDLQLHPNRHSENVKKTIEVHTDNCKQRLLETPTKCSKDSNEHKSSEVVSTALDKDLSNYVIADRIDQVSEDNKDMSKLSTENKSDEMVDVIAKENNKIDDIKLEKQQNKLCDKNNEESNVESDKTEIKISDKPLVKQNVQCESNTNLINEEKVLIASVTKTLPSEACSEVKNKIVDSSNDEIKYDIRSEVAETVRSQPTECNITTGSSIILKPEENVPKDKDTIKKTENITHNIGNESKSITDVITPQASKIHSDKSENPIKATLNISNNLTESDNYVKRSRNHLEDKTVADVNQLEGETVKEETKSELNTNPETKQASELLQTSSDPTTDVNLSVNTNIKCSENQTITQTSKERSDGEKNKINILPESISLQRNEGMLKNAKPVSEESAMSIRNSIPIEIERDSIPLEGKSTENILNHLPKELETVSQLKTEEKECKDDLSKVVEIKTKTILQSSNQESKGFNLDHVFFTNPKKGDNTDCKKMEVENPKKPDKLPEKVDAKLVKISSALMDVSKTVSNTEHKTLHEDSLAIDQNFSQKILSITKASTAEKLEPQKKNEYNQKLLTKNTKVSLLTSDLKLPHAVQSVPHEVERSKNDAKKESVKSKGSLPKPINNNKAAVPFGKWTEANRQEFLIKLKESKVPINTSNTKQLKQPNDLNRRDVLQKIDSQRQSNIALTKVQELNILNKMKHKHETAAFASKSSVTQKEKLKDTKVSSSISKTEESKSLPLADNTIVLPKKVNKEHSVPVNPVDMSSTALNTKKDSVHRKEINNQDLIDKTIEGIINRAVTAKLGPEDAKQDTEAIEKPQNATPYVPVSLDEIESKMNELHGIPFVERPPHELPKVFDHEHKQNVVNSDVLMPSKVVKSSFITKAQQKNEMNVSHSVISKVTEESDEEIIEHEPLTGDVELNKNTIQVNAQVKDKTRPQESIINKVNCDSNKKEPIITENDFDKFARRNSITYENCLTVNFDGKEHHNVVQTVIEKEAVPKKLSRNEIMLAESKAKSHKQIPPRHINFPSKIPTTTKATQDDDSYNKNYQSKVQIAYQSVMTAKRQQECPITIIEDKPVEVVFMDGNHEYIPHQLNVQGKELSPPKKSVSEWDHFAHSNSESLDSDILDASNDSKSQDDIKFKSKHQRKQVLTPVETPELELIEPGDLGIEVSPKKKRRIEDSKPEKNSKSLVPKKCYLLNRNIATDTLPTSTQDSTKPALKESVNQQDIFVKHSDPISAIDNLVKAAELLETQSENKNSCLTNPNSTIIQNSPIKRGRGRPRKYPLPEAGSDSKSPSPVKTPTPQKKPRLIDAKISKHETESEDEEINSDGEFVKENWTMGKINENIVCPICSKLFRSENVVFKHVKHCTGPSPSRSDSDKRSPRRMRQSQESDWRSEESKSDSMDVDEEYNTNELIKKRKLKERKSSTDDKTDHKSDIIIIEDTPIKDRDSPIRKRERLKHEPVKTMTKEKVQYGTSLVCEFCGKTFRQLSYLVSHRLQHKDIESKKSERDHVHKSLFSCEICKKEFRKLHHLVQHRIIHNQNPVRPSRKSSLEQNDTKITKDVAKSSEDLSAGFRCEPCDKSFRKLHHLVEHRETHDEINKKCNPVSSATIDTSKPTPLHHCNICKKTFKKLQHLIEHKEHHLDTSFEKSDDKSVKSSLSTKDIIHECPLCYMVFPNEHSLNKHHIICQRKKKQSAAKQAKQIDDNDIADTDDETKIVEASDEKITVLEQETSADMSCVVIEDEMPVVLEKYETNVVEVTKPPEEKKEAKLEIVAKPMLVSVPPKPETDKKNPINEKDNKSTHKKDGHDRNADKLSLKSKKHIIPITVPSEIEKTLDVTTSKKKLVSKERVGATVTKRQKITSAPQLTVDKVKTPDSSDDDEIRYMLNPDFKIEESIEGKLFMKVRAKKRSSLQIERPNSKDLMKRRISLQHPPKIPRLKVKPVARKPINTNTVVKITRTTSVPVEPQASTDSDDSDVKYSFPETVVKEMAKEEHKKIKRQRIVEKRKSLNSLAKRKSLGKMITTKQKVNPSPIKQIKKRTADAEHRCDCGQLFSSAALLTRHTSLAHTPPRIRRRRSPPPDNDAKPIPKRAEKPHESRKTIDLQKVKTGVMTRKSSINNEAKTSVETRKTPKPASLPKLRRSVPHKGVPVPEKMRKVMDKSKK